jgi:hypothetical protein
MHMLRTMTWKWKWGVDIKIHAFLFPAPGSFAGRQWASVGCSEHRLIGHSFYRRNFLRKSCATCREKCRRRLIRLRSTWSRATAFFSASGAALSQEVPTVKWMSSQPALWTPGRCSSRVYTCFRELLGLNLGQSTAYTHQEYSGFSTVRLSHDHARLNTCIFKVCDKLTITFERTQLETRSLHTLKTTLQKYTSAFRIFANLSLVTTFLSHTGLYKAYWWNNVFILSKHWLSLRCLVTSFCLVLTIYFCRRFFK